MEINWLVYGIECVCFVIAFTGMIMIPLCKNPVWWIHDYPQDIQKKYHVLRSLLGMLIGLLPCVFVWRCNWDY